MGRWIYKPSKFNPEDLYKVTMKLSESREISIDRDKGYSIVYFDDHKIPINKTEEISILMEAMKKEVDDTYIRINNDKDEIIDLNERYNFCEDKIFGKYYYDFEKREFIYPFDAYEDVTSGSEDFTNLDGGYTIPGLIERLDRVKDDTEYLKHKMDYVKSVTEYNKYGNNIIRTKLDDALFRLNNNIIPKLNENINHYKVDKKPGVPYIDKNSGASPDVPLLHLPHTLKEAVIGRSWWYKNLAADNSDPYPNVTVGDINRQCDHYQNRQHIEIYKHLMEYAREFGTVDYSISYSVIPVNLLSTYEAIPANIQGVMVKPVDKEVIRYVYGGYTMTSKNPKDLYNMVNPPETKGFYFNAPRFINNGKPIYEINGSTVLEYEVIRSEWMTMDHRNILKTTGYDESLDTPSYVEYKNGEYCRDVRVMYKVKIKERFEEVEFISKEDE